MSEKKSSTKGRSKIFGFFLNEQTAETVAKRNKARVVRKETKNGVRYLVQSIVVLMVLTGCVSIPKGYNCQEVKYHRIGLEVNVEAKCTAEMDDFGVGDLL